LNVHGLFVIICEMEM